MEDTNNSYAEYIGDGTTKVFLLSVEGKDIGYLNSTSIHGYVNGGEVPVEVDVNSPHLVTFTTTPLAGDYVLVRREVPYDKPYATFEGGNNFTPRNVNNSFLQQLYLTHELMDGFLPDNHEFKQDVSAGEHRLTNIADPVDTGDAVNFGVFTESATVVDNRLDAIESSYNFKGSYLIDLVYDAVGGEITVTTSYNIGYAVVSINGVIQIRGRAWSSVGGVVTFAEPLEEGDEVLLQIGVVYDPTVVSGEGDWIYVATGGEVNISLGVEALRHIVNINGVTQTPTIAFEVISGVLSFAEPLEAGDELYVIIKS